MRRDARTPKCLVAEPEKPLAHALWPDTGRRLNLGRSATYAAADRKEIPTERYGHLRMVPHWYWRQLDGEEAAPPQEPAKDAPAAPALVLSQLSPPPDDAGRETAAMRRLAPAARQLLRLPPELLGQTTREFLERRLDRHDWVRGDLRTIGELEEQFAPHLDRLS